MFHKHRSERGAVTIFLILIFTSIFAFVAIFIDFARMYALQAKTEEIVHAASRSLLSAYDPELADKYGLFAYGESDEDEIMSGVLQQSYKLSIRQNSLPLLGDALESSTVEMSRPLATYQVFERQIHEQMKYKAPIDFTLDIVNSFKPMAEVMKEASTTVDLLGRLQKLYDQREEKFDVMIDKEKDAAKLVSPLYSLVPSSIERILGGYSEYQGWLEQRASWSEQSKSSDDEDNESYLERIRISMLIANYQSNVSEVFKQINDTKRRATENHPVFLKEAITALEEAKILNEQMEQVIIESEQRPQQAGYNKVTGTLSTSGNESVGDGETIAKIRGQARSLLLPTTLFEEFKYAIDEQTSYFYQVNSQIDTVLSVEGSIIAGTASASDLQSIVNNAGHQVQQYSNYFIKDHAGNKIKKNIATLNEHRSHDDERKAVEKEAKGKLKEFSKSLDQLKGMKTKFKEHQEQFDKLQGLYQASEDFNKELSAKANSENKSEEDPYQAGKNAMSSMDSLYELLSEAMSAVSENGYESEYIADYFTHFDVGIFEELFKGNGAGQLEAFSDNFAPNKQEMEYILYGFSNPTGNVAASLGEIFAARLAIRTMEGFVKNVDKSHPLLILVMALLYGIEHAIIDMVTLCHEGSIELSDYLKIKLTYRDHLRIMLFMHGKSNARLSRIQSVITMNTDIKLTERNTYAKGEVTASMPLWFMPGVISMLGWTGVIGGRVEGGRYEVVKQADFSY